MIKLRTRIWAGVFLAIFSTVALAQFWGIPRRLFNLIVTNDLTVEGDIVVAGTSDFRGDISDSIAALTIADAFVVTGTSDLQGDISDSGGSLTIADAFIVTGTSDLQGNISDSTGVFTIFDTVDINGSLTTGSTIIVEGSGNGMLRLTDTNAATDEKQWRIRSASGQLQFQTRTDASGAGNNAILINRTGTTVDLINLTATNVQVNGSNIVINPAILRCSITFDPNDLAAGLTQVSTETCTGATTGAWCGATRDASGTGLTTYCRVSSTNNIVLTVGNHTNANVNLASATYQVVVIP